LLIGGSITPIYITIGSGPTFEKVHFIGKWLEHIGVSKNSGKTPKWMVKIMENPIKMDDLGGKPTIFGNIHICENHYAQLRKNNFGVEFPELFLAQKWLRTRMFLSTSKRKHVVQLFKQKNVQ